MSRVLARIILVVSSVLQCGLLIGCFALEHFSHTGGVARHFTWRSIQLERACDIHLILILVIVTFVVLGILLGRFLLKKQKCTAVYVNLVLLALLVALFAGFVLFCSRDITRAYYYICLCLAVVGVLQLVKSLVLLTRKGADGN